MAYIFSGLLLFMLCSLPQGVTTILVIDGTDHYCYAIQRDINIALIFSQTSAIDTPSKVKCAKGTMLGYRMVFSLAFKYVLDQVNMRQDILPNITLGFVILDYCNEELAALADMVYLLPNPDPAVGFPDNTPITCEDGYKHFKVIGVVGPSGSRSSVMVGGLSTIFHIPMVLTYASSDELSDKTRFAYTMRVVPPDRFQAEAMIDILLHFGWTYVSLLYMEGSYGENGGKQVERNAKKRGICLAFRYMFPSDYSDADAEEVVKKLAFFKDARVVIAFLGSPHIRDLLPYLERENLVDHFIWLGSDSFSVPDEPRIQALLDSALMVDFQGKSNQEFRKYFETVNPTQDPFNPFVKMAWQSTFDCSWDAASSDNNRSCEDYAEERHNIEIGEGWESKMMDGANVYVHALQALISTECPEASSDKTLLAECVTGEKLHKYMLEVEFDGLSGHLKFDSKGDFLGSYDILQYHYGAEDNAVIAVWDKQARSLDINTGALKWFSNSVESEEDWSILPESVCSKPCAQKQYYIQKELPCCWDCRVCRDNEILVGNKTGCAVCDLVTWPDEETATVCIAIDPETLEWNSPLIVAMVTVTGMGIAVCLVVAAVFVKNRQNRLIKASSRQLMVIILVGITMAYTTVILFLLPPSDITCYFSRFGFNLSVSFIYAPLMVKTSRIYRIFTAGKRGTKRPALVGTTSQLAIVTTTIILQMVICVVSAILAPPIPLLRQQVPTEKYVESLCSLPLTGLIPPLSLNLLFILTCAVYGFLTRKLPENFNESWYIFVSVATTTFLWLVFLPAYFTAFYAIHQVVLLASCLIINGSLTLLCLYVPKIYCIYLVDEEDVQFQTAGTVGTMSVSPATNISTVSKQE